MKKKKFLGYFAVLVVLFFITNGKFVNAFDFQDVCQSVFGEFLNGNSSDGGHTIDIEFPPGGGTTCSTAWPCPLVSLPANATVFSFKVDIELTDPFAEIKTPYIWIPITYFPDGVTENNKLKQISTHDCSVIETYDVVFAPSRTHVIPAGDVWVASLTGIDVSKLSPLHGTAPAGGFCGDNFCGVDETLYYCPDDCKGNKCGAAGNEDCRKYEVVGTFSPATVGGVKGITGTIDILDSTIGDIWTGNCGDGDVSSLGSDGIKIEPDVLTGGCPFGAVADYFDHIWIPNPISSFLQCINTSDKTMTNVDAVNLPYGIAVDTDSNVYVTSDTNGTVRRYDSVSGNCPIVLVSPTAIYDTFVHLGTKGVAIDQKGYVWTANSLNNDLYTFINPDTWYSVHPGSSDLRGVAIDFDGYGWVVSYDAGIAYKYEFDDVSNSHNLQCQTPSLGGKSDSYSDMTGLGKIEKALTVDDDLNSADVPSVGTFEVCTNGTSDCSDPPCAIINDILSACVPDEFGNCEIPLEVPSYQGGNYTLKNLEIIYKIPVPVTTGGLVPCGREWDDLDTPLWDETDPCQLCHLIILSSRVINFLIQLSILISVLALIIAGLIYAKTSGDSSLIMLAKQNVNKILYGFVIVFIAWVIVSVAMTLFGFTDPLGDGSWAIFSCDL